MSTKTKTKTANAAPEVAPVKGNSHIESRSWLWPDRTIGKRESRILREEHNALVNERSWLENEVKHFGQCFDGEHVELLKVITQRDELLAAAWQVEAYSHASFITDATTNQPEAYIVDAKAMDKLCAAIARAEGKVPNYEMAFSSSAKP